MTLLGRRALIALGAGLMAPRLAGALAPILERLNSEINKALVEPGVVRCLRQVGLEPMPLTVKALGDFICLEAGRWAELVRLSEAKAE